MNETMKKHKNTHWLQKGGFFPTFLKKIPLWMNSPNISKGGGFLKPETKENMLKNMDHRARDSGKIKHI